LAGAGVREGLSSYRAFAFVLIMLQEYSCQSVNIQCLISDGFEEKIPHLVIKQPFFQDE
jgi:hypothetical protein